MARPSTSPWLSAVNRGGQTTLDGDEVWTFTLNGLVDEQHAPPPPVTKVELAGNPIKLGAPMGATNTLLGDRIFEGTVDVVDYLYQPQQVQVPRGTTVNFITRAPSSTPRQRRTTPGTRATSRRARLAR